MLRGLFILIFFLLMVQPRLLYGKDLDSVRVESIKIVGNKVTKSFFILRELDFKEGDYLKTETLEDRFLRNRNRIFNTGLFNQVRLSRIPSANAEELVLQIEVTEKWYLWPYPVLMFADRNFNTWWETKDPSRLNIGLNVYHYNFRGRGEKLKISTLWGYTRKLALDYEIPYLDRERKKGVHIQLAYQSNKEIWYKPVDNRLQFLFDPNTRAIRYYQAELAYLYRPEWYIRHRFSVGFEDIVVSDTVLEEGLNPQYLAGGLDHQTSIRLHYAFKWDYRDIAYYPLRGFFVEINAEPRYLVEDKSFYGVLTLNAEKFFDMGKGFFAGFGLRSKVSVPDKQPYSLYSALGYKFFVRGFEPYVVDGQHYGLLQSNFKYRLISREISLPFISMGQFKKAPSAVYLTTYADAGYVSSTRFLEPGNTYPNQWLSGFGLGLDFVTYYDRVMRVEYSVNGFGRKGLYLHFTAPI